MDTLITQPTNFDLTEEQEMIRETVRRFSLEVVKPGAREADEKQQLNMEKSLQDKTKSGVYNFVNYLTYLLMNKMQHIIIITVLEYAPVS